MCGLVSPSSSPSDWRPEEKNNRKNPRRRRSHAISGLSMILNDTIKRGRDSHFIWARKRAEMMTSRRPDAQTRWREPAGELKINADSQRAPLLGGRDVPAYGRWGPPPGAGCGLVWVGLFQTAWIKHLMVSTVVPSWSWSRQSQIQCQTMSVTQTQQRSLMSRPCWTFTANDQLFILHLYTVCL